MRSSISTPRLPPQTRPNRDSSRSGCYFLFDGGQHRFRKAENIRRALGRPGPLHSGRKSLALRGIARKGLEIADPVAGARAEGLLTLRGQCAKRGIRAGAAAIVHVEHPRAAARPVLVESEACSRRPTSALHDLSQTPAPSRQPARRTRAKTADSRRRRQSPSSSREGDRLSLQTLKHQGSRRTTFSPPRFLRNALAAPRWWRVAIEIPFSLYRNAQRSSTRRGAANLRALGPKRSGGDMASIRNRYPTLLRSAATHPTNCREPPGLGQYAPHNWCGDTGR